MADVGILNLQIHHDSSQAEAGLNKLADALFRVKRAVNGGLKLSGVATQIRNIAKVVNENVNDTTISKLAEFGNALSRLKGLGNVSINIKSSNKIENTLESIEAGKRSIEQIGATGKTVIKELENDFGNFGNTMENITDTFVRYHDNVVATANNKPDFSAFDPSHLPLEALGMQLDKTSAEWKNYGAMVKDSFETIKNAGKLDTVSSIKEVGAATTAIIPYQEEVGHTWERITTEMNEKSKGVSDAYKMACEQALEYNADLNRKIGAIYDKRFETDITSNRPHAKALRGDWGEKEQLAAIENEARSTGKSVEEVRAEIEKLMAPINKVRTEIKYLFDTLGNVPKNMNWSSGIDRMLNIGGKFKDAQESAKAFMTDAYHRYQELVALLEKPVNINWRDTIDQLTGINSAAKSAEDSMSVFLQEMQGDSELAQQIRELNPELTELSERCSNAGEALEVLKEMEAESARESHRLKDALNAMKAYIGDSFIGRTFKKLQKTIFNRSIRYVIREVATSLREGVENVYQYSKAIGGSFAPAMDSAATALQQMKNSIGAAAAPVIQSLIPLLQNVVNWFITVVNYANQFFTLLRGQKTWTRALPATTTAFGNQEKAAKGAANALKDLLADWDELNIIQSETTGGGTGSTAQAAEDYLNMFEEVDEYDSSIRQLVKFFKDNLAEILVSAGAIMVAMKSWGLSKALTEALPLLSKIALGVATIGTVVISLTLTDLFGKQYAETGGTGWLIADALTGAVGSFLAGELATKLTGSSSVGQVTAGFTLILEGAINVKNAASAMENLEEGRAWALAALGSAEFGVGMALVSRGFSLVSGIAGMFTVGAVAATAALVLSAAILFETKRAATYRKMAMDAFSKTGEGGISIERYTEELQKRFNTLTENGKIVVDAMIGFEESDENFKNTVKQLKSLNRFITSGQSLTEEQAKQFQNAWDIVFEELNKLGEISYQTIFAGLEEAIAGGTKEIREAAQELLSAEVEVARMTGGARSAAQEEMDQIIREIASGDTSRADRYFDLYAIWGESQEQEHVDQLVNDIIGQKIQFTEGGNPVEEAQEFLRMINEDMVNPALELVQNQYDAELTAIRQQREDLDKAYASGYIQKEDYDKSVSQLDAISALFEQRIEEQKTQILGAADNAYSTIAEQLYEGFFNISDENAKEKYIDEIVNPILEIYKAAGRRIPEKLEMLLDLGKTGTTGASRVRDVAQMYGRSLVYQSLYDEIEGQYENVNDYIRMITASEGLNMQENLQKLTVEDQHDVLNALLPLFPETYAKDVIEFLATNYGFDRQKMLEGIDTSRLIGRTYMQNGEEYEYDINDMMEAINGYISEYNFEHPTARLEMSGYKETIEENITEPAKEATTVLQELKETAEEVAELDVDVNELLIPNEKRKSHFYTSEDATERTGTDITARRHIYERSLADVDDDFAGGVKEGTSEGFRNLLEANQTLITWLQRIYNKETTVKIFPSTSAGTWQRMNSIMYSNVTGEEP